MPGGPSLALLDMRSVANQAAGKTGDHPDYNDLGMLNITSLVWKELVQEQLDIVEPHL